MKYFFRCKECGTVFDKDILLNDYVAGKYIALCSSCRSRKVVRVFLPPNIIFRGEGFYSTDSRNGVTDVDAS